MFSYWGGELIKQPNAIFGELDITIGSIRPVNKRRLFIHDLLFIDRFTVSGDMCRILSIVNSWILRILVTKMRKSEIWQCVLTTNFKMISYKSVVQWFNKHSPWSWSGRCRPNV